MTLRTELTFFILFSLISLSLTLSYGETRKILAQSILNQIPIECLIPLDRRFARVIS